MNLNPNLNLHEDFLPLPLPNLTGDEPFALPPDSDGGSVPPLLPPPSPFPPPLPSSLPPPPGDSFPPPVPPEEIHRIATKFKEKPELLLETSAYKDEIMKLVLNLNLALEIFPVRSIYKCREDKNEAFIYTKQENIKLDKEGTKTLNFSGKHDEKTGGPGEKIVMNWLDRKKFGTTDRDVDVRRFFVEKDEKAKLDITLVVVVWGAQKEPSTINEERLRHLEQWAKHSHQVMQEQNMRITLLEQQLAVALPLNQFHNHPPAIFPQHLSQFFPVAPSPNLAINPPNNYLPNINNNNYNGPTFPFVPSHPEIFDAPPNTTFTTSTSPVHSPNSPNLPTQPNSPNMATHPSSPNLATPPNPASAPYFSNLPNLATPTNLIKFPTNANPREAPNAPISQSSKNPPNSQNSKNSDSNNSNFPSRVTRSKANSSSENVEAEGSEKKTKRKKDSSDASQPKKSAKKS